jgi:uncharacterized protein YkwD
MSLTRYISSERQNEVIQLILSHHDEYRAQNSLQPLTLDADLCIAAQWMAEDMADKGYMSHIDSIYRNPVTRVKQLTNFGSEYIGENVGVGYAPEGITDGWMQSPGHRANILRGDYNRIGIGYYLKPFAVEKADADTFDYMDYYCVVFGKK